MTGGRNMFGKASVIRILEMTEAGNIGRAPRRLAPDGRLYCQRPFIHE